MQHLTIAEKIEKLPLQAQREVEDFVDFMSERSSVLQKKGKLTFGWAGALKEYRDQYTSVGLQKKASEWRTES